VNTNVTYVNNDRFLAQRLNLEVNSF